MIMVLAFAIVVWGPGRPAWADPAIEAARASSRAIETLMHEMTQMVQQGQGSMVTSGLSRTVGAAKSITVGRARNETVGNDQTATAKNSRTKTGRSDEKSSTWMRVGQARTLDSASKLTRLSDKVLTETRKLEKIYRDRKFKDGIRYVKAIASEADRIKKLVRVLGGSPTANEASRFYSRVGERLRHKNRAHDGHKKWIDVLSVSLPSSREKPGEEIHTDEYGRVKTKMSTDRQRKSGTELSQERVSRTTGDPDRPVVTGRVYTDTEKQTRTKKIEMEKVRITSVSAGSSGAKDRPTENITLNYTEFKASSTMVIGTYEYDNRLILLDRNDRVYALSNGIYLGTKGNKILVQGKKMTVKGSGEVVIKGSNIKENSAGGGETASGMLTGRRTYEPITIRPSKGQKSGKSSSQRRILPLRLSIKSPDGRYTSLGGAWFELKGEVIIKIGGPLDMHSPPPFLDVGSGGGAKGQSGSSRGNVEMEFKVEKGE